MPEHLLITDPQIHEPKDLAALNGGASDAGKVYTSDGAASGDWLDPSASNSLQYGGIYSTHTDGVTISTIGTTVKLLQGFSHDSPANGMTPVFASHLINVDVTGDYFVNLTITFATAAVGDQGVYQFHIRVNGVESIIGLHRSMSGTTDTGSGAAHGILSLNAGDVLTVWVESDEAADTDDIVVNMIQLSALLAKAV